MKRVGTFIVRLNSHVTFFTNYLCALDSTLQWSMAKIHKTVYPLRASDHTPNRKKRLACETRGPGSQRVSAKIVDQGFSRGLRRVYSA